MVKLFDSHAHLDDKRFDKDRDEVIEYSYENGIKRIINVGADVRSIHTSIELARKYDFIFLHAESTPTMQTLTMRMLKNSSGKL